MLTDSFWFCEVFIMCLYPFYLKSVGSMLPCGKCVECLNSYSTEFAVRCMLEAREHSENCFLTLTYNNENCPESVSKRDFQLFIKRLRFSLSQSNIKIRIFGSGEYGSQGGRPHYHIIVFGFIPKDLVFLMNTKKGEKIYKSDFISSLWGKGFISVGDLTFNTAKYCAKYLQKLCDSGDREKPFILSSRRPGIGGLPNTINYIISNCLVTDKIYINGLFYRIPTYYLKVLEKIDKYADTITAIRSQRQLLASNRSTVGLDVKRVKFKKLANYYNLKRKWLSVDTEINL